MNLKKNILSLNTDRESFYLETLKEWDYCNVKPGEQNIEHMLKTRNLSYATKELCEAFWDAATDAG